MGTQEAPAPTSFIQAHGFEVLRFGPHEAEIALSPRPDHLNTWGVLHGGMAMSLLDVAMAHAARSPQTADEAAADPRGVVTIEMKTSFMRPGEGRVTAVARRLHQTSTLAFCEGKLLSDSGELIAHATGTFKFMRALPAGGREVRRHRTSA